MFAGWRMLDSLALLGPQWRGFRVRGRRTPRRFDVQSGSSGEHGTGHYGLAPLIPTALAFDRIGIFSCGSRAQDGGVVGEEFPGIASSRADVLAGFELGNGEAVGAQAGPNFSMGSSSWTYGGTGRRVSQSGTFGAFGPPPAGAVTDENGWAAPATVRPFPAKWAFLGKPQDRGSGPDPRREATKSGHFWTVRSHDRGHGGTDRPVMLFHHNTAAGRGREQGQGAFAEVFCPIPRPLASQCNAACQSGDALTEISRKSRAMRAASVPSSTDIPTAV